MKVYENILRPASGGFGMWDMGEASLVAGCDSIDEWVAMANENGFNVRDASEVSGKIYGQGGATVFAIAPYNPKTGETIEDIQSFHIRLTANATAHKEHG